MKSGDRPATASKNSKRKLKEYLGLTGGTDIENDDGDGVLLNQHDVDIEQTKKEIRALLIVNEEIFTRCMTSAQERNDDGDDKTSIEVGRFGYNTITTRQTQDDVLEFMVQAEHDIQEFDISPLSTIPNCFNETITFKYKQDCSFAHRIDFDDFFQRMCMFFNDDLLGVLLPKLKDHLVSIQVCLGCIEEWIMQAADNLLFINSTFGKKLKIPTKHSFGSNCYNCGDVLLPLYLYPSEYRLCLICSGGLVLYEMKNEHGQYNTSFDVSMETERERLLRFITFVTGTAVSRITRSEQRKTTTSSGKRK